MSSRIPVGDPAGRSPASWRDHDDAPTSRPAPPVADDPASYRDIGAFQGSAYRRNAFAMGTEEEVTALRALVGLRVGTTVLDVGCADGRHLRRLAADGVVGTGLDVSPELVDAAGAAARAQGVRGTFVVGDARSPDVLAAVRGQHAPGGFDVVWSLCQGALGTSPATDAAVLAGLAAAVRTGGLVVVTFFHALFAARHLAPGDAYDTVSGVHHQVSEVRGPDDAVGRFDLWTVAYTVREACALLAGAGLRVVDVRGAEPGGYGRRGPWEVALDDPELLVVAERHGLHTT